MFRTSNPALAANAFDVPQSYQSTMTLNGTINKGFILLLLLTVGAMFVWSNPVKFMPLMLPAIIVTLVVALITIFKKTASPITAPIYALCEGVVLGVISATFERQYPGIAIQAVTITFGVLFCMLFAYRSGLIKATAKFKIGVVSATGAIFLVYVLDMVLGFFGKGLGFLYSAGPLGILISLAICTIAALNLILDFDIIE